MTIPLLLLGILLLAGCRSPGASSVPDPVPVWEGLKAMALAAPLAYRAAAFWQPVLAIAGVLAVLAVLSRK